jgi:hypothetical protein
MNTNQELQELYEKSLSQEEIVLEYEDAIEACEYLLVRNLAILGFEIVIKLEHTSIYEELDHYVIDIPEGVDWELFVESSYKQVIEQLTKEYDKLKYSEMDLDRLFFVLTPVNRSEFESYYYQYLSVDQ